MLVNLGNELDRFRWNLTTNGLFSVKSMYEDLMNDQSPQSRNFIWKLKIPLKNKIFMWFLHHKVLLTKDNLAKRQWTGCTKCVFCGEEETIEHIFLSCPVARLIWKTVNFTYNLPSPSNISHMFGSWLDGVEKHDKAIVRIGVSALCWSIWKCRNDIIFNKRKNFHFLQVIYSMLHWIQLWALLSPMAQRDVMDTGCRRLRMAVRDILCQAGWQHISRIHDI
jgi:hypothetical protein